VQAVIRTFDAQVLAAYPIREKRERPE